MRRLLADVAPFQQPPSFTLEPTVTDVGVPEALHVGATQKATRPSSARAAMPTAAAAKLWASAVHPMLRLVTSSSSRSRANVASADTCPEAGVWLGCPGLRPHPNCLARLPMNGLCPPDMASISNPFDTVDFSGLPPLLRYTAGDGAAYTEPASDVRGFVAQAKG